MNSICFIIILDLLSINLTQIVIQLFGRRGRRDDMEDGSEVKKKHQILTQEEVDIKPLGLRTKRNIYI